MDAKCPRCGEKGEFDPASELFRCSHCGTELKFREYVEKLDRINDEKSLDYAGRGSPTP